MNAQLCRALIPIWHVPPIRVGDVAIQQATRAALRATRHRAVAELDCDVCDGSVVLSGVVASYYLKQVAQAAVLRLGVVRSVENAVVVQWR